MTISMHSASVPVFTRMLGHLVLWMDKAEAHAQAKKFDPSVYLVARLAPDMHRYVVVEHGWISDAQFTSSIAIAQAAPGPNVLFVAVIVLASSMGGTPVLMASADSPPDVPLSVQVVRSADGGADVLVTQSLDSGWDGMPASVADELAHLPELLDRALG